MRDFLQISHFEASNSTFSYEFSYEPPNLLPQNRCLVQGFRVNFHHISQNAMPAMEFCTLSPLEGALTTRFAQNTQHDTSKCAAPATQNNADHVQSAAPATKTGTHLAKTSQKYCDTQTTFDTLQNTSECHEVPHLPHETKQRDMCNLQKYPKVTPFAELTIGTAIGPSRGRLRTVADGCGRKRNVERTQPQPCYAFENKILNNLNVNTCPIFS